MSLGCFLKRELITSARRPALFKSRFIVAGGTAAVVASCVAISTSNGLDPASAFGVGRLGLVTFGCLTVLITGMASVAIPSELAGAIASERDRKSLDSLLATRLSSAEIVLGRLAAELFRSLSSFCAILPVFVLVVWLGRIDPRFLLLLGAGLASTVLALAALAVAVSSVARSARRAAAYSLALAAAWMYLPVPVVFLLPRVWPAGARWLTPGLLWLLDSSPFAVPLNLVGVIARTDPLEALLRMIALQTVAAGVLVSWAIWRFRPASRGLHDVERRASLVRCLTTRRRWRPPCGDDPVLWNEIHRDSGLSPLERIASGLVNFIWLGLVTVVISWFAWWAFWEVVERGYGTSRAAPFSAENHPLARVIVAKSMGLYAGPAPGQARAEFNVVLRQASAVFALFYVILIAGAAAESVTVERERDTWQGLITTPLSGVEILRAKMCGALVRYRGLAVLLIVIWTAGVCCGALHPVGMLAALASMAASAAFFAAYAVRASLRSHDRKQAVGRVIPLILFTSLSGVMAFIPVLENVRVFLAAGSAPFLVWSSLLSYDDVHAAVYVGKFPQLAWTGLGDSALPVLCAWLLGTAAHAIAAFLIAKAAFGGFDKAVDRPRRAGGNCSITRSVMTTVNRWPSPGRDRVKISSAS